MKKSEIKLRMKEVFCFGLTQKVYESDPKTSLKTLFDALALSKQLKNPSFWPKVISYRLAHLLMRDASTEENFNVILELLNEEFYCAPILHIKFATIMLEVVCLHRISLISEVDKQSEIETRLKRLNHIARDRSLISKVGRSGQYPLQDLHFNLLELATYFTGSSYNWHSQFSSETPLLLTGTGQELWKIIAPDSHKDLIHYDPVLVEIELKEMMSDCGCSSFIKIGDDQSFEFEFHGQNIEGLSLGELELISVLIENGGSCHSSLLHRNSDRTTRRRIDKISKILSINLIKYDPSKKVYVLSPKENIFLLRKV